MREIAKGLLVLLAVGLIAVLLICLLISLLGPGFISFFKSLSALDSTVIVALVTGTATVVAYISNSVVNNRMKRDEYLRLHREAPYMQLISMFCDFQAQTKLGHELTQEELMGIFNKFTKELTLWGSSEAINAWGNWRIAPSKGSIDSIKVLFGMEKVLMQLRRDMGLKAGLRKATCCA